MAETHTMRNRLGRACRTLIAMASLGLVGGCDDGGVTDIVFGSLQLAFGIVDLV